MHGIDLGTLAVRCSIRKTAYWKKLSLLCIISQIALFSTGLKVYFLTKMLAALFLSLVLDREVSPYDSFLRHDCALQSGPVRFFE